MKNVIFDLGGVVLDWNPKKVMQEFSDPDFAALFFKRGFFERYWADFDRGVKDQTTIAKEMSGFSGGTYARCWDLLEFIKHSLTDLSETVSLIKELSGKGYPLFCLSNMSDEFYDYLKGREVFRYFDGQIISALEKVIKPEPEIYNLLARRFGIIPQESVFIDDLLPNVEAAASLGFHTVHFADKEEGMKRLRAMLGI